eukprot:CAMPEP_0179426002 /NCGR_PEP_ID=MMETSP0799-20121207/12488_1 /TAXON_ID=46947 /ORGANISM="Geminigera cryophila, Strain CCMP2564" /LENGTH=363 /DNA_ID=CAMNT_0021200689 /DNA_START=22 /DNA_END=1109 /DNA_ORIENTATION=+
MASPPHDLIHDLVHTHGLQAIWRLMVQPRIHRPSTILTDAIQDPPSLSSIAPTPLFDAPKPVARQEMPKFPSAPADKLTNMASTPTAFALTDLRLRGVSPVGFGSSRTEIAKLLQEMQPIVVKRDRNWGHRNPSNPFFTLDADGAASPALSSTTTTGHLSISPETTAINARGSGILPPKLITSASAHYVHTHTPSPAQHMLDLAAVEALLTLSTRPPSLMHCSKRPRCALKEKHEEGASHMEVDSEGWETVGAGEKNTDHSGGQLLSLELCKHMHGQSKRDRDCISSGVDRGRERGQGESGGGALQNVEAFSASSSSSSLVSWQALSSATAVASVRAERHGKPAMDVSGQFQGNDGVGKRIVG